MRHARSRWRAYGWEPLLVAVLFGGLYGLGHRWLGRSVVDAAQLGGLWSVVPWLSTLYWNRRTRRRAGRAAAESGLAAVQVDDAVQASRTGRPPEDPEVRRLAARFVEQQLGAEDGESPVAVLVVLGLLAVVLAVAAVRVEDGFGWGALAALVAAGWTYGRWRVLTARLAGLRSARSSAAR